MEGGVIGDKLVITDYHRAAAHQILDRLIARRHEAALAASVSGESGSGKSETAHCLGDLLEAEGLRCVILAQDDYFRLPPRSNHARRLEDFSWIGPGEVRLDLLDAHVAELKARGHGGLRKPLVYFEEDRIGEEVIPPGPYDVVIVEGTYTALLANLDVRAFIDRDYRQTKKARLERARDPAIDFLERVHGIISRHRELADVVIAPPPGEAADHSS
jgi:uridine kinase